MVPDLEIREVVGCGVKYFKRGYYYPEWSINVTLQQPYFFFLTFITVQQVPLDAFEFVTSRIETVELEFNCYKNEWMQENDHPYFEGSN